MKKVPSKGFTLIELLISIAIIGIISGVIYTSLGNSKARARNAIRESDLKQLKVALDVYYEQNSSYPSTLGQWWGKPGTNLTACSSWYNERAEWIPGLVTSGVLSSLPEDPSKSSNCAFQYIYRSNGYDYKLISHGSGLDNRVATYANSPLRDPRRDNGADNVTGWPIIDGVQPWAIGYYTSGAASW